MKKPNYKKIFEDIIKVKCIKGEKKDLLMHKIDNIQDTFNVIDISKMLFEDKSFVKELANQRLKSYLIEDIVKILKYQFTNNLSDKEIAFDFNIAIATIRSWKKKYKI